MGSRDLRTYDLGPSRRGTLPWGPVIILAVVVLTAVGLVAAVVAGASRTPSAGDQPAAPATTISPAAPPTGVPPAPRASATASPPGSDAREGLGVPEGSQQAASRFVAAWLDRNPATRRAALRQVAVPALAEELMITDPAKVPSARAQGAPVLANASTYSAQFTQALTTGMRIQVYLVADPAARHRWLATSVEQA